MGKFRGFPERLLSLYGPVRAKESLIHETTIALIAVAVAAVANVVLQVLAKIEATKVAAQAREDAGKAQQSAKLAAREAAEVKVALVDTTAVYSQKLDAISQTTDSVHVLVNNNMEVQLRLNAELSRWKASQTGMRADMEAATLAEKLLKEHMAKQATVDKATAQVSEGAGMFREVKPAPGYLAGEVRRIGDKEEDKK